MRVFRSMLKFSAWALAAILSLLFVAVGLAYMRQHRTFNAPYPALRASQDSALVEYGRYLAHGPARCADCHATESQRHLLAAGGEAELAGGHATVTYLGRFYAPNITPDPETGIGAVDDSTLARFMRTGINRHGEVGLPFMEYAGLTDRDIVALLSYLRSLPPIQAKTPAHEWNVLGIITKAFFLEPHPGSLVPSPSQQVRLDSLSRSGEVSVERGAYLATAVANCRACHTARNMKTGEYTSAPFAGGLAFTRKAAPVNTGGSESRDTVLTSPNLTPYPESGRLTGWSEDLFVARFKAGSILPWSPMPWGLYTRMRDSDMRSIYRYLKQLPAICYACPDLADE
jgi:mono/diheme cytochrome c family protein